MLMYKKGIIAISFTLWGIFQTCLSFGNSDIITVLIGNDSIIHVDSSINRIVESEKNLSTIIPIEEGFSQKFINDLTGMFFGVLLVLAIINLIYYFIHHDRSYIIYSIYILILFYYEASTFGYIDSNSFGNFPVLYYLFENFSLHLSLLFYLLFLKSFINIKSRFPKWNKIINYLISILILNILISSFIIFELQQQQFAIIERSIFFLIALPVPCVLMGFLYYKGNKIDHIFLVGSLMLLISGFIAIAGILFFEYQEPDKIFQIGIIIELIIFNIALGVKSRYHEKEKQFAQSELIKQLEKNKLLQISVNEDLEYQVNERTQEIQTQNEELATQRDALEEQNSVIAQGMKELESIKSHLEKAVENRTNQLKKANQKLVQHNSQLEQYAFITAHNLRGPVARLKGLMLIFEKTAEISKQNNDIVEKIVNSAMEMDDVLSDMNSILEIKHKDVGEPYEVDIKEIIHKVKKILFDNLSEAKAKIILTLDVQYVTANIPYLESIIYNLVGNSIKYKSNERKLKISISSYRDNSSIILEVSDNGIGIDLSKYRSKIFGLYQRFHDQIGGKGLGLYLVKTQVESLGGTIEMDSQVDEGTTFKIYLPR